MTTVINNPGNDDSSGFGGMLVGIVLVVLAGAAFFIFLLPMMQGDATPQNDNVDVNVQIPTGGNGGEGSQE